MMYDYIEKQLEDLRNSISYFAEKYGRDKDSVSLLAVSKTFPAEAIEPAYRSGQLMFGENRVQELAEKVPLLPHDIEWHLIGHLQGNKVSKAVELAHLIHSVDSEKLLRRINRIAGDADKKQKILLEINISGEESKFGETADADAVASLVSLAVASKNIELMGFMTMAPFGADENELRRVFSSLRELRDDMEKEFDVSLPELSMGMSSDYEYAIAEGATIIRVGTSIFGKRD
jgi:pyridoxal phosphate enzyme (YggS family)